MRILAILLIVVSCFLIFMLGRHVGYGEGRSNGREFGYSTGYKNGFDEGREVPKITIKGYSVWGEIQAKYCSKYGTIHDTPWEEFNIREKMFLCAYGSPGNKLSAEDGLEILDEYGDEGFKNLAKKYGYGGK